MVITLVRTRKIQTTAVVAANPSPNQQAEG
jgi:hypothetical protein